MKINNKNKRFYPPTVGRNKAFYLYQDEYNKKKKKLTE